MAIEELKIKYPSGLEHAVHMTKEELKRDLAEARKRLQQ